MAYQKIVSTGSVYKGKTGMWLYVFHRVTGVGLFGYLLLHIISTALILLGPDIYEGAEAVYKNFYFYLDNIYFYWNLESSRKLQRKYYLDSFNFYSCCL